MPGVLFLFWLSPAEAQRLDLASELFSEGRWEEARREALRVIAANPDDECALLLAAQAEVESCPTMAGVKLALPVERVLEHLAAEAGDSAVRARASYEAGRLRWAAGDLNSAWLFYGGAFRSAKDHDLFLHSGCALFLLRQYDPALGADDPALLNQLATCRNLWNWELRDEVRVSSGPPKSRLTAKPGEWITAFYRSQISPAIGHRCSLQPSCSSYFLEASRKHGLLGVPLIADRLVREPGVVSAAEHPVEVRGQTRFADPLSEHVEGSSK